MGQFLLSPLPGNIFHPLRMKTIKLAFREPSFMGIRHYRSAHAPPNRSSARRVKPKSWERHGLKSWIQAAKKRLHHNVLAIALANKLARIAWAVLHKGRDFESGKTDATAPQPA